MFEDNVEQFPLFYTVCLASTGEDLACFVFDKQKSMNATFSKLVSVTTDGASSMIGIGNGMTRRFKRLLQQETRTDSFQLQQVWCLARRLNLVLRDLQHVPNIGSVFFLQIGSQQSEGRLRTGSGFSKRIQMLATERYPSHQRRDGLSCMMY